MPYSNNYIGIGYSITKRDNRMKELLVKYQNMVIYRQSIIMLIAAPVPAAMVKLQGSLLTPQTIAFIIIAGNVFAMCSSKLNTMNWKSLFVMGNVVGLVATFGSLGLYMYGVGEDTIIIYFSILLGLGFMLVGLAGSQIKNMIKDKVGRGFDTSVYDARKLSVTSAAAVVGQMLGVAFYMAVDVEPMKVLLVLEIVNAVVYSIAEVQRWKIVKQMGL